MSGFYILLMLALFALSIPIALVLTIVGMAGLSLEGLPAILAAQQFFIALDKFPLVAIPMFILAGNLMDAGGISVRLVDLARALVGNLKGGLACTCVLTCMIFASMSGSSVATTYAIGGIIIPAMVRGGYPVPFAASLQATSAELGVIIPPSITMILYGVVAEVSIGDMFIAGIGPGLLIGFALMAFVVVWSAIAGYGNPEKEASAVAIRHALWRALAPLMMPVIVLGGIYGGIFTPTEASVVAVAYALLLGCVFFRAIGWRELGRVLQKSVISSGAILFIIAAAGLFSNILTRTGIGFQIQEVFETLVSGPVMFLLVVNILLFLVGMFVETGAAVLILAPILVTLATRFGIDPVHFGIIMVVNLALGMVTPPFGVNLFAACDVAKTSIEKCFPYLVPLVLLVVACLAVITYVPGLSMGLVTLLR